MMIFTILVLLVTHIIFTLNLKKIEKSLQVKKEDFEDMSDNEKYKFFAKTIGLILFALSHSLVLLIVLIVNLSNPLLLYPSLILLADQAFTYINMFTFKWKKPKFLRFIYKLVYISYYIYALYVLILK